MRFAPFVISCQLLLCSEAFGQFNQGQTGFARQGGVDQQRYMKERVIGSSGCSLNPGSESAVIAVLNAQTLQLADGRFVRLAEIIVPDGVAHAQGYNSSAAVIAYLKKHTLGKRVEVRFGGTERDRYGIYTGHVFVKASSAAWLQSALIEQGLARVFPQIDNKACSRALMVLEAEARAARRGFWGSAIFNTVDALETRKISGLAQSYQIIEGEIKRVQEKGNRVTLYFEKDGTKGIAVSIDTKVLKAFNETSNT